jgi:aryl-alcohol dehydrogenase-like predicted oxidoreductase
MGINGHATAEGTHRYSDRFQDRAASGYFRPRRGLWLSSIGIGTYLGKADEITDARYTEAVSRAVEQGANVIDTAANYRFQRSERSIGQGLQRLLSTGAFQRDEIFICTKGGYLSFDGAPPPDVQRFIEEQFIRTGLAKADDFAGGSHSMAPGYLQHEIDQSLRNLGINCIDLYYLHNPESQLGFVTREEFELRLRRAFELLEENRAARKLIHYGVATWNGFRADPSAREYHSLERMVELARSVGGEDHGCRFVQLPFNLAMTEALTSANQEVAGQFVSLIEAAQAFGITVIASASILQGRAAQALEPAAQSGTVTTGAQAAIQFVRSTPGITTALVGMSRPEHVDENLELINTPPLDADAYRQFLSAI